MREVIEALFRELVDEAVETGPGRDPAEDPLLRLHQEADREDLADLWATFSNGGIAERISLVRVMGEAQAELPAGVAQDLVSWLDADTDGELLPWVVARLAFRQPPMPEALAPAVRLRHHPDTEVRYSLTSLLTMYVPDPSALDTLLELAGDDDEDVRFGAVFELVAHRNDGLVNPRLDAAVIEAAQDASPRVRRAAASE